MAAATGANLRERMERMGHSSSRAAMIYQHASGERDDAIAAAMGSVLAGARRKAARPRSGTQRARGRARESVMILAATTSVVPLTWGFG